MTHPKHIFPLFDADGKLHSVLLSAELWLAGRTRLEPVLQKIVENLEPAVSPEPLHEWESFKTNWDFRYPFSADVECLNCGVRTEDWLADPEKPFRLKSAQLGGLAVFACQKCGATVRKKHFKDHVRFECTPLAAGRA